MAREILDEYYGVGHIRCRTKRDLRQNPTGKMTCEILTLRGKEIAKISNIQQIRTSGADDHATRVYHHRISTVMNMTDIDYLIPKDSGKQTGICQLIKVNDDVRLICRRDTPPDQPTPFEI